MENSSSATTFLFLAKTHLVLFSTDNTKRLVKLVGDPIEDIVSLLGSTVFSVKTETGFNVYVAGGFNKVTEKTTDTIFKVQLANLEAKTAEVSVLPLKLPHPLQAAKATEIGNLRVICGGISNWREAKFSKSTFVFDTSTESLVQLTEMPESRAEFQITSDQNNVYVAGGNMTRLFSGNYCIFKLSLNLDNLAESAWETVLNIGMVNGLVESGFKYKYFGVAANKELFCTIGGLDYNLQITKNCVEMDLKTKKINKSRQNLPNEAIVAHSFRKGNKLFLIGLFDPQMVSSDLTSITEWIEFPFENKLKRASNKGTIIFDDHMPASVDMNEFKDGMFILNLPGCLLE